MDRHRPKKNYGITRKAGLLTSVPPGVTALTLPVLAPVGTVVVISEGETTVSAAAVQETFRTEWR